MHMEQQGVMGCGSQRSHVVVTNENLCKQRDPHLEIEFDFDEKHIHLKWSIVEHHTPFK